MLIKKKLSDALKEFILTLNDVEQEDRDEAIQSFCDTQELVVYDAIRSLTITIPPGTINIVTNTGSGTNVGPIVLSNVIS